jgi:hypothetical protein
MDPLNAERNEMPDAQRKRLFSRAKVAEMLDVSLGSLANLQKRGILNEPVDAGGPRWTERDVEDAIRALEAERAVKKLLSQKHTDAHTSAKRSDKAKDG